MHAANALEAITGRGSGPAHAAAAGVSPGSAARSAPVWSARSPPAAEGVGAVRTVGRWNPSRDREQS